MKVKLKKPVNWFGPYQLAEAICFWAKKEKDEIGMDREPEWVHNFGTWLAENKNGGDSWLTKFLQWYDKVRRKYPWNQDTIHIDYWDTWSMDHSLSHIILPMLKQLKARQHGAPLVQDEDVPKHLRAIYALPREKYDVDGNHFARWDWVLDEMIFAFEHKIDDSWEETFCSGQHDIKSVPCEWDENGKPTLYTFERGPNDTYKCDYDGMAKVHDRIENGFRLFGKYYSGLWD